LIWMDGSWTQTTTTKQSRDLIITQNRYNYFEVRQMKNDINDLGQYIISICGHCHVDTIADEIGYASGTINKWTRGHDREIMKIDAMIDLAEYLSNKDNHPPLYHILKMLEMRDHYHIVLQKWIHKNKWGKK